MHQYLQKAKDALETNDFAVAECWLGLTIDSKDPTISQDQKKYAAFALTVVSLKLGAFASAVHYFANMDLTAHYGTLLGHAIPITDEQKLHSAMQPALPTLPDELFLYALTLLKADKRQLSRFERVSRSWRRMTEQENSLWQIVLTQEIASLNSRYSAEYNNTIIPVDLIITLTKAANIPFKKICYDLHCLNKKIFDLLKCNDERFNNLQNFTSSNNSLGIMLVLNAGIEVFEYYTVLDINRKVLKFDFVSVVRIITTKGYRESLRAYLSMKSSWKKRIMQNKLAPHIIG